MDPGRHLKIDALERRAEWLRLSTQEEMTKSALFAFLGSVQTLDTFAGWLLGTGAAILAILVSNLDSVAPYIAVSTIRQAGILFLLSAFAGALEKALALWVSRQAEATREIYQSFDQIFAKHGKIDEEIEAEAERIQHPVETFPPIEPVMEQLAECTSRISRWFLNRAVQKAQADRLWGLKFLAKTYRLQATMLLIQVLFFGGFGVVLILGLGGP